jgi:hypothetical protein
LSSKILKQATVTLQTKSVPFEVKYLPSDRLCKNLIKNLEERPNGWFASQLLYKSISKVVEPVKTPLVPLESDNSAWPELTHLRFHQVE